MDTITSTSSDRVRSVRSLHTRAGRRKAGRFIVEGPPALDAALRSPVRAHELFVDEARAGDFGDLVARATERGVRATRVSASVMNALSETRHPQGILAVFATLEAADMAGVMDAEGPVVVLDAVSDPGNVGTVIRTADAAAAAGVVLTPDSADVHGGKVVRSTAGSLFNIPVLPGRPIEDVIAAAHRAGRKVAAATGTGSRDLFEAVDSAAVDSRTCWIIGSEAHGVSAEARAGADLEVRIWMAGRAESLNAAVAAAVVLYVTRHAESRVPGAAPLMRD